MKRDHNFSPEAGEQNVGASSAPNSKEPAKLQLYISSALDTEESSLLSQSTRYLTLISGPIVLPVIVLMSSITVSS